MGEARKVAIFLSALQSSFIDLITVDPTRSPENVCDG